MMLLVRIMQLKQCSANSLLTADIIVSVCNYDCPTYVGTPSRFSNVFSQPLVISKAV